MVRKPVFRTEHMRWILSIPLLFVQKYRAEPAPIRQNWIALRKIDFAQNEPRRKAWFASPVFRTEHMGWVLSIPLLFVRVLIKNPEPCRLGNGQ